MKKLLFALLLVAGASSFAHAQTQVLADTSLEVMGGGGTDWTSTSTSFGSVLCDAACGTCGGPCTPHSGTYYAWFGGTSSLETGTLTQSFNVPAAGPGTLSFWFKMPNPGNTSDSVLVSLDGGQIWAKTGVDSVGFKEAYARVDISIPSLSSGSHTLLFTGKQSGTSGLSFNALVDDITLNVSGSVGIAEYDFSNGITTYADYSDQTLNIAFSYTTASNPTIMVTDMAGRVIESRKLSKITNYAYTIGTSTWAEGIYNVTIIDAGESITKKVHIHN